MKNVKVKDVPCKKRERTVYGERGLELLVAAIVSEAMKDYATTTENIHNQRCIDNIERNRKDAEIFFRKSRLFKLTGLDADYLKANAYKVIRGRKDEL